MRSTLSFQMALSAIADLELSTARKLAEGAERLEALGCDSGILRSLVAERLDKFLACADVVAELAAFNATGADIDRASLLVPTPAGLAWLAFA